MSQKSVSSEEARVAHNAYHKNYRTANPVRVLKIQLRYFEKKIRKIEALGVKDK